MTKLGLLNGKSYIVAESKEKVIELISYGSATVELTLFNGDPLSSFTTERECIFMVTAIAYFVTEK